MTLQRQQCNGDVVGATGSLCGAAKLIRDLLWVSALGTDADVDDLLVGEAAAATTLLVGKEAIAAHDDLHRVVSVTTAPMCCAVCESGAARGRGPRVVRPAFRTHTAQRSSVVVPGAHGAFAQRGVLPL